MERQRGKQAEPWQGWGIRAVTCSDPAHPEHGGSRHQAPAASLLSPSVIVPPSSARPGPGAAARRSFCSPQGRVGGPGRRLLPHAGIWGCEGITRRDGHVFVLYQVPQDHSVTG